MRHGASVCSKFPKVEFQAFLNGGGVSTQLCGYNEPWLLPFGNSGPFFSSSLRSSFSKVFAESDGVVLGGDGGGRRLE